MRLAVAGSLGEALDCLEKDHQFLLKGDVFTEDFLDMWISNNRKEHDALRLRPHPYATMMCNLGRSEYSE